MIKKSITYTDYNDNEVTEDFYFNFTKMELMEKELELGGLENILEELQETEDVQKAYQLFKQLILAAYGKKSEDGKRFIKSPELTAEFEQSPACSELIVEFIQNPQIGAQFMEGTLPAKLIQEAKAAKAKADSEDNVKELPTAPPVLDGTPPPSETTKEPTDEELLKMKPQEMTHEQLQRAFALKSQQ